MSTTKPRTVGDTYPPLSGVLTSNGGPANLTNANTGTVHIVRPDASLISHAAALTKDATGVWSMALVAGDLTIPGDYVGEVEVVWMDTTKTTFGRFTFPVQGELA